MFCNILYYFTYNWNIIVYYLQNTIENGIVWVLKKRAVFCRQMKILYLQLTVQSNIG
jgi:hypothetical protein